MSELKKCPFCGETEPVRLIVAPGKDGWRDRYFVLCDYEDGGCGAESGWYHSQIEAIEAWDRSGRNMSEWTSVKDKLPEKPGRYLVSGKFFDSPFRIWICDFYGLGPIRGWSNPCRNPTVSYWMPIPEPPKEES